MNSRLELAKEIDNLVDDAVGLNEQNSTALRAALAPIDRASQLVEMDSEATEILKRLLAVQKALALTAWDAWVTVKESHLSRIAGKIEIEPIEIEAGDFRLSVEALQPFELVTESGPIDPIDRSMLLRTRLRIRLSDAQPKSYTLLVYVTPVVREEHVGMALVRAPVLMDARDRIVNLVGRLPAPRRIESMRELVAKMQREFQRAVVESSRFSGDAFDFALRALIFDRGLEFVSRHVPRKRSHLSPYALDGDRQWSVNENSTGFIVIHRDVVLKRVRAIASSYGATLTKFRLWPRHLDVEFVTTTKSEVGWGDIADIDIHVTVTAEYSMRLLIRDSFPSMIVTEAHCPGPAIKVVVEDAPTSKIRDYLGNSALRKAKKKFEDNYLYISSNLGLIDSSVHVVKLDYWTVGGLFEIELREE